MALDEDRALNLVSEYEEDRKESAANFLFFDTSQCTLLERFLVFVPHYFALIKDSPYLF